MPDWNAIKTEYITNQNSSYTKLAEKFSVSRSTIAARAGREQWPEEKEHFQHTLMTKTMEKVAENHADKLSRIQSATDELLDKIEQAIRELDVSIVIKRIKTDNGVTEETTEYREAKTGGIVDRAGVKQIASALKDIKEIQMLKSELDRAEQEARIANLRRQADAEDKSREPVQVVISGELGDYAE